MNRELLYEERGTMKDFGCGWLAWTKISGSSKLIYLLF